MLSSAPIAERGPVDPATFLAEIIPAYRPVVLRDQVTQWPAVAAGRAGIAATASYLGRFDQTSRPVEVMVGPPEIKGRFFYDEQLRGFNFTREQSPLGVLLRALEHLQTVPHPPALYAGAAATADHLPGFSSENPLPLETPGARPRIWIGNKTRVAPHYDVSHNIACVIAGQRRFTLFPPDQIDNLYVGPLEWTPAGQPVSMVDIEAPDYQRFPRFAQAAATALTAELGPGDVIYIPTLWWHAVDASAPFNVLLNYWWGAAPQAHPFPALIHAILAIRDLPEAERTAWRHWFEHYVFSADVHQLTDHLPPHVHGVLGAASASRTVSIHEYLKRTLDRV